MTIQTNDVMNRYLEELGCTMENLNFILPEGLTGIIEGAFIDNNNCVTLQSLGHSSNPAFKTEKEKFEWEYNETHFHPDSYIGEDENEIEFLKAALECGQQLAYRLKKTFPGKQFRIIISFSETRLNQGEVETYGSSTVRFHQIRPELQKSYWDDI